MDSGLLSTARCGRDTRQDCGHGLAAHHHLRRLGAGSPLLAQMGAWSAWRVKNLRKMVGEREFSESLNVRDTPCYITRRHGAGETEKSDSGGAARLVLGVAPKFQLKSPPARFGLANRKSWSTARPPHRGPQNGWAEGPLKCFDGASRCAPVVRHVPRGRPRDRARRPREPQEATVD